VCEKLQLLTVPVFHLCVEFSMNSHFTHPSSSECKPLCKVGILPIYSRKMHYKHSL
jgi:hypothetical protein